MPKKPKKFKRAKTSQKVTPKRKLEVGSENVEKEVGKRKLEKREESPNNLRIITERWLRFPVWLYSLSVIAIVGVLLLSANLQKEAQQFAKVREQRSGIERELQHWQQMNMQYPGSKDINVKLATIEYQLGDFKKAKMYVEKALQFDPNDNQALEMQKILKNTTNTTNIKYYQ